MAPVTSVLTAPVTINGRLSKPGQADRYQIQVTPGEPLTFRIQAIELGTSKLMAVISVFDGKGANWRRPAMSRWPMMSITSIRAALPAIPRSPCKLPRDANSLTVAVEDLARRGGPAYGYRLNVLKGAQDFRVILSAPYANVPAGGSVVIPVAVERHGYDGDVRLRVANAPKGLLVEGGNVLAVPPLKENYRPRNSPGVLILTATADTRLDGSQLIVEGVAELPDGSQIVRRAEGPGMTVGVAGATLQGSVDRQRPITAPWLGLELPAATGRAPAATLEVSMGERKRLEEGDQIQFRWKWSPRDPNQAFPKSVNVNITGAADIRIIDAKTDPKDPTAGTFVVTTTKLTLPAKYDLYISGRLMADGQSQDIVSRPIQVEVLEVRSTNAAKTNSNQ